MLKHILFLRSIELLDLQKIIFHGPHRSGVEFIGDKIKLGRLEISYIYDSESQDNNIIGLECDASREIDINIFYSIVEYIGTVQISIHRLTRI